mmetsp:Transcript_9617/g.18165  ORF Transcript_9617/g.18165 Transcript_9617/m.18165 type:complete len:248 (-) Transcript_9617:336-1079(-)
MTAVMAAPTKNTMTFSCIMECMITAISGSLLLCPEALPPLTTSMPTLRHMVMKGVQRLRRREVHTLMSSCMLSGSSGMLLTTANLERQRTMMMLSLLGTRVWRSTLDHWKARTALAAENSFSVLRTSGARITELVVEMGMSSQASPRLTTKCSSSSLPDKARLLMVSAMRLRRQRIGLLSLCLFPSSRGLSDMRTRLISSVTVRRPRPRVQSLLLLSSPWLLPAAQKPRKPLLRTCRLGQTTPISLR